MRESRELLTCRGGWANQPGRVGESHSPGTCVVHGGSTPEVHFGGDNSVLGTCPIQSVHCRVVPDRHWRLTSLSPSLLSLEGVAHAETLKHGIFSMHSLAFVASPQFSVSNQPVVPPSVNLVVNHANLSSPQLFRPSAAGNRLLPVPAVMCIHLLRTVRQIKIK
jgi:hypothetical protein